MTGLGESRHGEDRAVFGATSAAGAMLRQVREPVIVGVMLAGIGTSPVPALPLDLLSHLQTPVQQTTAGASFRLREPAGTAIAELRRLCGFTWDQLARLFDVSRRSLHFWASGKTMAPANEEHLQRTLAVVRHIDRGSANANRAELLTMQEDGSLPFDLLAAHRYERVVALLGPGAPSRVAAPELSEEAKAARRPRAPEDLVEALQDRVHQEPRVARAAKSVRVRGDR